MMSKINEIIRQRVNAELEQAQLSARMDSSQASIPAIDQSVAFSESQQAE